MNSTTKLSIDLNGFTTFCEQNMSARFRPNMKYCILSVFLNENCPCGHSDHRTEHISRADTDLTVYVHPAYVFCSTLNETCLTIVSGTNLKIYKAATQNARTYTGSDILGYIRKTINQEPDDA